MTKSADMSRREAPRCLTIEKLLQQVGLILMAATLMASTADATVCPERCQCRSPEVYCPRTSRTTFPEGLEEDTTFLDVGHNNITEIPDDTFANLGIPNLVVLVADNNSISNVAVHAFRGLKDLQFLHLSGNRLSTLHSDLFRHNPAIHHVDLTGNALLIPSDATFLAAPSLEWLDMDYCSLMDIPSIAFTGLPKLRYLNLNNNSLRDLNVSMVRTLSYLRYLKLLGNPLKCDCSLKPLWTWLFQHKTKVEGTCGSPPRHGGRSLSLMKDMTC